MSTHQAVPKNKPVKYCTVVGCNNKLNTHNDEGICNACIVERRYGPAPTDPPRRKYNRTKEDNRKKAAAV